MNCLYCFHSYNKGTSERIKSPLNEQKRRATMKDPVQASRTHEDKKEDNRLRPETRTWAAQLPPSLELRSLIQQFPRIANHIASLWAKPVQCERYIDELLFNDRSGLRQGFPPQVGLEIMQLKNFLIDVLQEKSKVAQLQMHDIWGKV
jgi:hypothetical protein